MNSEVRKIYLIEKIIKIKIEALLIEMENVFKKTVMKNEQPSMSAHDFKGLWSKEDAELIEKAIEEGCE
jgi:3-dehydroquinate dehydratase